MLDYSPNHPSSPERSHISAHPRVVSRLLRYGEVVIGLAGMCTGSKPVVLEFAFQHHQGEHDRAGHGGWSWRQMVTLAAK